MRKPKLIILSGCPGVGKSTLSKLYADRHPMALNLDIDTLWFMMGQWEASRPTSHTQKMKLAYALAAAHLASGFDVIVAQHLEKEAYHVEFANLAKTHGATCIEILLRNNLDVAIERFIKRGKASGHPSGFRPGGIVDTGGRERHIALMHKQVDEVASARTDIKIITVVEGEVEATYGRIMEHIKRKTK
jgi:predicted kinase